MKIFRDEASVLLVSAVVVASPRYMGAFAYALGVDITVRYPFFIDIEILSGLALAILEGLAIAYVARQIQSLKSNSPYRRHLIFMVVVLLVLLSIIGTPYMHGTGMGEKANVIMPIWVVWVWDFVINMTVPIFAAAVGYASGVKNMGETRTTAKQKGGTAGKTVRATPIAQLTDVRAAQGELNNRQRDIMRRLEEGTVRVAQIAQELGVHRNTITNDLRKLATIGYAKKNGHGWEIATKE